MFRKMKKLIVAPVLLCFLILGCGKKDSDNVPDNKYEDNIVVGFSQLGAESDWRNANTESMKSTFSQENGYELIFEDGQQKQANQIMDIRTFIQKGVDYIVLAPVTETGWDTVLQEAKNAGIPVIIVDRMVDVENQDLDACWVGSDFELEGCKATEWLRQYLNANSIEAEDIHIVNLQGTLGGSAQIGRTNALRKAAEKNGWDLMAEVPADFTQAKGREVMEALLKEYDNINVVYCENDNEALGAIEAIEAAGKTAGTDIKNGDILIISFDGVNDEALNYVTEGKIGCIVECNPLQGPKVQAAIEMMEAGMTVDRLSYVSGKVYSKDRSVVQITVDSTNYDITFLDDMP